MSSVQPRVDYDQIAHTYDQHPYRQKQVDPELVRFVAERQPQRPLDVLDLGCGTGSQLIANQAQFPTFTFVGMDRFMGMLRQAQAKSQAIAWVQGDSSAPPFGVASFDYITCQFSFHHVQNKPALIQAVARMLRAQGRFVYSNICPHEMHDWIYYRYFPAALEADLEDFWSPEELSTALIEAGLSNVRLERTQLQIQERLADMLHTAQARATCSQLITIPDQLYERGIAQIKHELAQTPTVTQPSHVCLLTVCADNM